MASVQRYSPGMPEIIKVQEGAGTQTFKSGDLIHIDSSGQAVVATAGNIDGIAQRDASGTQTTWLEVELIDLNALYVAKLLGSESTSLALCGDILDFTFTIGAHTLSTDSTAAATDTFVVQLDPRDTLGTAGGRLIFRFLPALVKG